MNELREFDKRSRDFPLGDHFINSHNLIPSHCMDIVGRKLTLGLKGLTGQSWRILKSWYTGGGRKQGFWRFFADRLYQKFSFVCEEGKLDRSKTYHLHFCVSHNKSS